MLGAPFAALALAAPSKQGDEAAGRPWKVDPAPSAYRPAPSGNIAIVHATILTAAGPQIEDGTVLIEDNRIREIGTGLIPPQGFRVIDAAGQWLTPGIIDAHTHLGRVSIPSGSLADGMNENSSPNTAETAVENDIWPQSPAFPRIRAAGVTTVQVLPGSANIFGGRSVVLKLVPALTVQDMKFPGAASGLKMACGENPTRVYGARGQAPVTRAAVIAAMRQAFYDGQRYAEKWDAYGRGKSKVKVARDFRAEVLAGAVTGDIPLNIHCYRADDMANVINVAREFGVRVASFHHGTEAFKIAPLLKQENVCVLGWGGPDWGGFKMEALDYSALQVPLLDRMGVCVAITSDSEETGQHLNLDAARSLGEGLREGLALTRADAIRWITINPAQALGIAAETGSIEKGKMADLALWSGDPFSSFSRAERVFIDGVEVYVRGSTAAISDFDVGRDLGAQP